MERELLKAQNKLITNGNGVILFGVWTIIKAVLQIIIQFNFFFELADEGLEDTVSFSAFAAIAALFLFIIILIILLFHFFIGLCAKSDALGKKNRIVYIIVAALYAVFTAFAVYASVKSLFTAQDSSFASVIIALIFDITLFVILIELVLSAIRVKRLRKLLKREQEVAACS